MGNSEVSQALAQPFTGGLLARWLSLRSLVAAQMELPADKLSRELATVFEAAGTTDAELVLACRRVPCPRFGMPEPGASLVVRVLRSLLRGTAVEALVGAVHQSARNRVPGAEIVATEAIGALASLSAVGDFAQWAPLRFGLVLRAAAAAIAAFPTGPPQLLRNCCVLFSRSWTFGAMLPTFAAVPTFAVDATLDALVALHRLGETTFEALPAVDKALAVGYQVGWLPGRHVAIPPDALEALVALLTTEAWGIHSTPGVQPTAADAAANPVVGSALRVLFDLAKLEPEFGQHASREGAAARVVRAMADNPADPRVQKHGAEALAEMSLRDPVRSAARALAAGALEAAVAALRAHGTIDHVAKCACRLLALLSWSQSSDVRDEFVARAGRCGAASVLESIMALHVSVPAIIYDAILALDLLRPAPVGPGGAERFFHFSLGESPQRGGAKPLVSYRPNGKAGDVVLLASGETPGGGVSVDPLDHAVRWVQGKAQAHGHALRRKGDATQQVGSALGASGGAAAAPRNVGASNEVRTLQMHQVKPWTEFSYPDNGLDSSTMPSDYVAGFALNRAGFIPFTPASIPAAASPPPCGGRRRPSWPACPPARPCCGSKHSTSPPCFRWKAEILHGRPGGPTQVPPGGWKRPQGP